MYYPVPILQLMHEAGAPRRDRLVSAADVEDALDTAQAFSARAGVDEARMLRRQGGSVLITAGTPLACYLLFDWPAWLIVLTVLADAVFVQLADEICRWRARARVDRALAFAVRIELALRTARAIAGAQHGAARVPVFQPAHDGYHQHASGILMLPLLAAALATSIALQHQQAGPVVTVIVLVGIGRIFQALADSRASRADEAFEYRLLPRMPDTLAMLSFALLPCYVAYQVGQFHLGPDDGNGDAAVLMAGFTYLIVFGSFAVAWLWRMHRGARQLRHLQGMHPEAIRTRLANF